MKHCIPNEPYEDLRIFYLSSLSGAEDSGLFRKLLDHTKYKRRKKKYENGTLDYSNLVDCMFYLPRFITSQIQAQSGMIDVGIAPAVAPNPQQDKFMSPGNPSHSLSLKVLRSRTGHHSITLSRIAGFELIPAMDVDIGHVNISVRDDAAAAREPDSDADNKPAFGWHIDSYAFVCVTMLSDCAGMIGGETVIRTGTGEVLKFRGPATVRDFILLGKAHS
ncbi:unnamed protein product [Aspergillus oryzae]|nr:unnamed protein product [Aspergillus oryzae]GMF83740.1 unnamed protein product [Aspergillus oryzae]GMG06084.1 unnamed protein product [Aspergillus oryzae]